jgi:hypothetical protein
VCAPSNLQFLSPAPSVGNKRRARQAADLLLGRLLHTKHKLWRLVNRFHVCAACDGDFLAPHGCWTVHLLMPCKNAFRVFLELHRKCVHSVEMRYAAERRPPSPMRRSFSPIATSPHFFFYLHLMRENLPACCVPMD